jgi:hypothetical protein
MSGHANLEQRGARRADAMIRLRNEFQIDNTNLFIFDTFLEMLLWSMARDRQKRFFADSIPRRILMMLVNCDGFLRPNWKMYGH